MSWPKSRARQLDLGPREGRLGDRMTRTIGTPPRTDRISCSRPVRKLPRAMTVDNNKQTFPGHEGPKMPFAVT